MIEDIQNRYLMNAELTLVACECRMHLIYLGAAPHNHSIESLSKDEISCCLGAGPRLDGIFLAQKF